MDQITVVTPTIGASFRRLSVLCQELRRFTTLPFRHIISDDGTISGPEREMQLAVANIHGAVYTENPGPYGVSYNLNHAFSKVTTPWCFLVEDGLRPSFGWLETALDFIDKIGDKEWNGKNVGMAGCSHIQDWQLRMAGILPSKKSIMDTWMQRGRDNFWSDWNDGLLSWGRILPGLYKECLHGTEELDGEPLDVKRMLLNDPTFKGHEDNPHFMATVPKNRWPYRRKAGIGWYCGAFMLVNMQAWREVGKFRDGCTFFEGHLGVRMGMAGYLVLCLEFPPFLHCPSLGFSASDQGRQPRLHRDTRELFLEDFGHCNMSAPNVLATGVTSLEEQLAINEQLDTVELAMVPEWK